MTNPWLNIPYDDYENHMSSEEVGQLQVLSKITQSFLKKHKPEIFTLLGCCTGNGLEHVNNSHTKKVYAIDINPDYLTVTKKRFEHKITELKLLCIDINTHDFPIFNADMVFGALIFEYLNIENAVKKISYCLKIGGKAIIIIQKNNHNSFVSKTKFSSLSNLKEISNEVNEDELVMLFKKHHFHCSDKKSFPLPSGKEFLVFEFEKILS